MFTPRAVAQRLEAALQAAPAAVRSNPACCVALSGGLDSTVLLAALAELRREHSTAAATMRLRAVHVDHALHADSPRWALACRAQCEALGVPLDCVRVDARAQPGASPEATAREARYRALADDLQPGEVLLTAHHADDQLETVLLQWLRGGGLRAVAGMAPLAPFGRGAWHARPLLEFTRAELEGWARSHDLHWCDDPSNADVRFDRNYLRREVLPAVRLRWPAAARTAGRVATYAREALDLEESIAGADFAAAARGCALDLDAVLALESPRQRAVLRHWLRRLRLPVPPSRTLGALLTDVRVAATDRVPRVEWPGVVVHRYRSRLYATTGEAATPQPGRWSCAARSAYEWSADSTLALVPDTGRGFGRERLPALLDLRGRSGGESFRPSGQAHRRELRKWLQEHDVLPWRRAGLPLLWSGERLLAVADLAVDADFAARPDEPSWRVEWQGRGVVTATDAERFEWSRDPPNG